SVSNAHIGSRSVMLEQINRTDVVDAIALGTRPMRLLFDREHGGLPFFRNEMTGPRACNRHHPSYSMSHVPGRWLDALVDSEDTIGIHVDQEAEGTLRTWLIRSMDNEFGLPAALDLDEFKVIPVCDLHNLREVMHGLAAMCMFRADTECASVGERLIASID